MYTVLFLGLPVLGIALFVHLRRQMLLARIVEPPVVQLFAVFAAYGTVLLIGVSEYFRTWSAMLSLGAVATALLGVPWLLIQGALLLWAGPRTRYHTVTAVLSVGFPLVLIALYFVAHVLERFGFRFP